LQVEGAQLRVEGALALALPRRHGLGDVAPAAQKHVEQHARLRALRRAERLLRFLLRDEEQEQPVVRLELVLEEALLLLLVAGDLRAQRFED
jgi:hypothetical protein